MYVGKVFKLVVMEVLFVRIFDRDIIVIFIIKVGKFYLENSSDLFKVS